MTLYQLKKITKNMELSPKEKATILFWNCSMGSVSGDKFNTIFTPEELRQIIGGMNGNDYYEYKKWINLIESTQDYDQTGSNHYYKLLGLFNEITLITYKSRNQIYKKPVKFTELPFYSITLNKEIKYEEICGEIGTELINYFSILIIVLIHQYILDDAINFHNLLIIQNLNHLYKLKNHYQNQLKDGCDYPDPRLKLGILTEFFKVYQLNQFNKVVDDYVSSFETIFPYFDSPLSDNRDIKDYVIKNINKYYPGSFSFRPKTKPLLHRITQPNRPT